MSSTLAASAPARAAERKQRSLLHGYVPGAGFGDPLLRAPERLAADLRDGRLPRAEAERFYGVVLDDAGRVDAEATAARRNAMRGERLARSRSPREPVKGRAAPGREATGLPAWCWPQPTRAACRPAVTAGDCWPRRPDRTGWDAASSRTR